MNISTKTVLLSLSVAVVFGVTQGRTTSYMDRVFVVSQNLYDNFLGQIGQVASCYRDVALVSTQVAEIERNLKCKQQQLVELSRGNGPDLRSEVDQAQALSACMP